VDKIREDVRGVGEEEQPKREAENLASGRNSTPVCMEENPTRSQWNRGKNKIPTERNKLEGFRSSDTNHEQQDAPENQAAEDCHLL
jgi:hypothetical protein